MKKKEQLLVVGVGLAVIAFIVFSGKFGFDIVQRDQPVSGESIAIICQKIGTSNIPGCMKFVPDDGSQPWYALCPNPVAFDRYRYVAVNDRNGLSAYGDLGAGSLGSIKTGQSGRMTVYSAVTTIQDVIDNCQPVYAYTKAPTYGGASEMQQWYLASETPTTTTTTTIIYNAQTTTTQPPNGIDLSGPIIPITALGVLGLLFILK